MFECVNPFVLCFIFVCLFVFGFFRGGFLMVCVLAGFAGVDQVMLLISLSQWGCEGGEAMVAVCCAPKAGC